MDCTPSPLGSGSVNTASVSGTLSPETARKHSGGLLTPCLLPSFSEFLMLPQNGRNGFWCTIWPYLSLQSQWSWNLGPSIHQCYHLHTLYHNCSLVSMANFSYKRDSGYDTQALPPVCLHSLTSLVPHHLIVCLRGRLEVYATYPNFCLKECLGTPAPFVPNPCSKKHLWFTVMDSESPPTTVPFVFFFRLMMLSFPSDWADFTWIPFPGLSSCSYSALKLLSWVEGTLPLGHHTDSA